MHRSGTNLAEDDLLFFPLLLHDKWDMNWFAMNLNMSNKNNGHMG